MTQPAIEPTPGDTARERIANARERLNTLFPPIVRTTASWAAIGILGVLVAVLVFVAIAPRLLGLNFVIVAGGSMEPAVPFGSLAVMHEADTEKLQVGDIITYRSPNNENITVTHRITAISPQGEITTRGDANSRNDDWVVTPQSVQHKFMFAIPRVGSFVQWLGTPRGFLAIVLIPGIIVITGEVRSIVQTIRHHKRGTAPNHGEEQGNTQITTRTAGE